MAEKPTIVGPFPLGVNNVDRSRSMEKGALVSAFNLNVDRAGVLTKRPGFASALEASGVHSLWAPHDSSVGFYVAGADLKLLTASAAGALSTDVLRAGAFQAGVPLSYVDVDGTVYYSNGIVTGLIRPDLTSHPWGVERPVSSPILTVGSGNLPAGWYMVGLQYVNDLGEVSGMPPPLSIEVPANSSIVVSAIPVPVSADVVSVSVYVTQQNGDILLRYGNYPAGTTAVTVNASATLGRQASGLLADVMPPANILEYYNGRIYGAAGSIIYHTNALNYGLCALNANFIPIGLPVTVLKAVSDGLYVGTGTDVIFLGGAEPQNFSRALALPFGAIPGTGLTFDDKPGLSVGWLSERGFVRAGSGGQVNLSEKARIAVGMFASGAALYREQDNVRQVISTARGSVRSAIVSSDYAEAEVRRNGVII